ncbi:MAG TPA: hemolysin family protein [Tenuifilaceae bacterium]|nr:hemolysin family protein [Tenuifilaceae bacterium]HPE17624.1 hemolysin family protein [Tenuifilaceae bacterium]HPJ44973.1 hemolysin family protein [Tenuifilaceae bacterium]HPQ33780.1 hemolysin family protein [Tenuifilaceae bacterium]HRX67672.1 hemolysin family protein [Tenuifilaceae bacterium]
MNSSLLVIGVSILFSALFSGMEIAFVSANKLRIELNRKKGTFSSRIIQIFTRNPGQYIATMLVGNNIALVVYGIEIARLLEPRLSPYILGEFGLLLTQTLISTIVILITAEFLPKSLFRLHPNGFLNFFSLPMLLFYIVFYPVSKMATWISMGIIKRILRLRVSYGEEKYIFGKIDLDHFVGEVNTSDDDEEKHDKDIQFFQNALDFSEIKVRDCMIPRTDIEAIEVNASIPELLEKFIETNYSRLPVHQENVDNIIGYVNSKDLFKKPQSIKSKLIKIDFVPETMRANKLLTRFIKEHKSIAIVVDEFGGTAGLVTIEDIIEEIIGEIDDEHDLSDLVEKQLSENEFILSGRLEVDYLNDKYKFGIPESDEYDTLAGFVLSVHQSIPNLHEVITQSNFRIKVAKMDGTRIDLIHFSVLS